MEFGGYDGTTQHNNKAQMYMYAGQNYTTTAHGTGIKFSTVGLGSTSRTDRMTITPDGNVGIGTTSPNTRFEIHQGQNNTSTNGFRIGNQHISANTQYYHDIYSEHNDLIIHAKGDAVTAAGTGNIRLNVTSNTTTTTGIYINSSGNVGVRTTSPSVPLHVVGNACTTGTGMTACASDKRLKENVQPITNALSTILQLNPVSFTWNKISEKEFGYKTGQKDIGVIAQEIEKINPEWVRTTQGDYKAVNDTFVKWYSVKAIQELALRLRSVSDALAEEKSENAKLREELRASVETLSATAKAMSLASLRTERLEERLKAIENWQMAKK